ncbi:hypothetical protein [Neomesorhizobium albiziae]|uniref:hypothetical protein n=1 Tax=Neomesorhizobium albiziae TaxID=335020 RepID=UPI00165FCB9E|nr:hypothetical protein [Mesorhizobium albiziae]GLS31009.1 hypothetical protein GCM10007937_27180 [Mesorhizobium albiziae]
MRLIHRKARLIAAENAAISLDIYRIAILSDARPYSDLHFHTVRLGVRYTVLDLGRGDDG